MLKKMKSVSMLLALAGISSTGAAYAVAVPEVDETRMRLGAYSSSQLVLAS